ncbi:MAG: C1 family peptidase [Hungatella sp.]|jgi:bleomycin hydrolase|nr:C1 family peptidase [Hungatella sp.]
MSHSITPDHLGTYSSDFNADRASRVARDAVMSGGLLNSCKNPAAIRRANHEFSLSLKQGKMTNQKQSGRCWLFAATNVMRFRIIKSCNLENFELSQSYLLFWDKLEKSNWFLENILDTLEEPVEGRLVSYLLTDPVCDGGQWDMAVNLINKYGVVPKYSMPESSISSGTREMNRVLTELLRNDACILRDLASQGTHRQTLEEKKAAMLNDIYRMLCICLGEPPKTVDMEARDKDGNFIQEIGLTPREFFKKYVDMDLNDYISLINAPTADKPFHRRYTVRMLGNVKEGNPICYINLPIEDLKKAAIAQLKDGEPVWFGCDMGPCINRDLGIMDTSLYDLSDFFQLDLPMTKGQRLDYGQSLMTHAMVFQGVNLTGDETPTRWRVENSWGEDPGQKGYFIMSDDWFNEYMYQVVVNKKYLTKEQLDILNTETIALNPWDPMGSLA